MFRYSKALIFALSITCFSNAARADDYEQYCDIGGVAQATRQTIIVLDERLVYGENGDQNDGRNGPWRRFIGRLVNFESGNQLEQRFLPRERLSLLLARKDGSGLISVFSGCLPFYSKSEQKKMASDDGATNALNSFMGWTPAATASRDAQTFISRFGEAIRSAVQKSELSTHTQDIDEAQPISGGLISSLKQGAFIDLGRGLPRVVVVSDMASYFSRLPADVGAARAMGLQSSQAAGLNLRGAEVYVVGEDGNTASSFRDALSMFFLGSRGNLISVGSVQSTPEFLSGPTRVLRYQGLVQFPESQYPIRMRLAMDQNGTLVDSWFSIQGERETYTPLHGVLTCEENGCTYSGDNVFAQVWNIARADHGQPTFDSSLPFGGARVLQFSARENYVRGDISDPIVQFHGQKSGKQQTNRLHFYATLSQGIF